MRRYIGCDWTVIGNPFYSSSIKEANILVAIALENPKSPGCKPVVLFT
jgi:hypothetical protein